MTFQTKPRIALDLVERALSNGIRVAWWTFDEFYGRDSKVLDGLKERGQRFVCEIPRDPRVWTTKPDIVPQDAGPRRGLPKQTPCEVLWIFPDSVGASKMEPEPANLKAIVAD